MAKKGNRTKKKYTKPLLISIDLAVDEVLAVNCKTPTGGGRFAQVCSSGWEQPCASNGS